MLRTALLGVLVLGVLLAGFLAVPVDKQVSRSRTIAAPVATVYAEVSDLSRWPRWLKPSSPHLDGSDTASPTELSWIVADDPSKTRVSLRVEKLEPSKQVALEMQVGERRNVHDTLELTAKGEQTEMVWVRRITLVGIAKLAPLIHTPESIVGPQLEGNLKSLADALAAPPLSP